MRRLLPFLLTSCRMNYALLQQTSPQPKGLDLLKQLPKRAQLDVLQNVLANLERRKAK